jgi:hypothetical protein
MPLIGLSANIIPYILAMLFTLLVFNKDRQAGTDEPSKVKFSVSTHIINFRANDGATAIDVHNHVRSVISAESSDLLTRHPILRTMCIRTPQDIPIPGMVYADTFLHRGPPSV